MNAPNVVEQVNRGYFASRWNGHVSRASLFWWDMVVVGTLVNIVAGLLSLILLVEGVHGGVWAALHLLLVPYNLFLLVAVWRRSVDAAVLRALAVCWFGVMLLV